MDNGSRKPLIPFFLGFFLSAFITNADLVSDIFKVPLKEGRCYIYQSATYSDSFRYKIIRRLSKQYYRIEYHRTIDENTYPYVIDKKVINPEDYGEIDCRLYDLEEM